MPDLLKMMQHLLQWRVDTHCRKRGNKTHYTKQQQLTKMDNQVIIKEAQNTEDLFEARKLILEYVNWLGNEGGPEVKITLASQNFDKELDTLNVTYGYPDGAIFLAIKSDKAVAVGGIKRFNDRECEVKRMFVQPGSRGAGIGKLLLTKCIEAAKSLHYETIKLDTADFMKSAIKLYTDAGFVEIAAYRYNTHKEARYFELDLKN
jgi:carbonic anhydrase